VAREAIEKAPHAENCLSKGTLWVADSKYKYESVQLSDSCCNCWKKEALESINNPEVCNKDG